MPTREIKPKEWQAFLDEFSRRHQGVLVTIETADPDTGAQEEAKDLPFVGITFEAKGSDADSVQVMAGTEPASQITHTIFRPKTIYHKEGAGLISDEINREEILEITSADDPPVTYLRFQHGNRRER